MKLLTTNFLTCAVKACKSSSASFPLHFRDAVLERTDIDFNPLFIRNILPRVNWEALTTTAAELGVGSMLPDRNPLDDTNPEPAEGMDVDIAQKEVDEEVLRKLHALLLETGVVEGKLVCGNCGFEYPIKEGVANFLLPAHLV
ncbi:TRM112-like protein [Cladophialophora carrionii]|uniref:TRM112-like protein n=1 Tax=Cladophialophora carrionii TaxID=86049 RepID=A0A1C1CDX6_9EURO|nr:TRM112-like protein [Cladophialophora carrionii]